jgi:ribosome-associated protein
MFITPEFQIAPSEFRFSHARSSGPGGQNVNKVNTKVTLHWNVVESESIAADVRDRFLARFSGRVNRDGELVLQSQRYRDQLRNRDDCLQKLRQMLLVVLTPPKSRRRTRPTRASRHRRLKDKRQTSQKKQLRRPPSNSDG